MEDKPRCVTLSLAVIALVAMGFALIQLKSILMPLFVAFFLTMLFGPSMTYLQKRGTPSGLAMLLVIVVAALMIYILGRVFYEQVPKLIEEIPRLNAELNDAWEEIEARLPEKVRAKLDMDWLSILPGKETIAAMLGNIFGVLSVLFVILVYMIFLLVERHQLSHRLTKAYGKERGAQITAAVAKIQQSTESYIVGKTVISLGTGVLFSLILWYFDVKFFVVWGMMAFLFNFVPYLGSVIATILPILTAIGQCAQARLTEDPALAQFTFGKIVIILLLLTAVQVAVGSFIEPRLLGNRLRISPLVVFLSFMVWGWLWGLPGIILSVPIIATIKIIMENVESLRPLAVMISNEGPSKV
jgi:predicted PurR-regulated permease PerM